MAGSSPTSNAQSFNPTLNQPVIRPDPAMSLPALLTSLGGLGANIAGIATGKGAVGNSLLSTSNELQNDHDVKNYRKFQGEQDTKKLRGIEGRAVELMNDPRVAKDKNLQLKLQDSLNSPSNVDEVQNYLHQLDRDATSERKANQRDDKYVLGAAMAGANKRIAELSKPDKEVQTFETAERALQNLDINADSIGSNAEVLLRSAGIKDSDILRRLKKDAKDSVEARKQGGFLGFGAKLPEGTKAKDVFTGLKDRHLSPEVRDSEAGRQKSLEQYKALLRNIEFAKKNLGAKDPEARKRAQAIIEAVRSQQ